MKNPIEMSPEQIAAFESVTGDNARALHSAIEQIGEPRPRGGAITVSSALA